MPRYTHYTPLPFFCCTFLVTWSAWFAAVYYSHQQSSEILIGLLMLFGLLGPVVSAFLFIFRSGPLRKDVKKKLFQWKQVRLVSWAIALVLMPCIIVVSILLSPLVGQSLTQLRLSFAIDIMDGSALFSLLIIFLAPALEELGWSSYGIDSLQSRCGSIFRAALIFGILWSLWHLPLFFIKGYYHYRLVDEGFLYVANFFISVIPLAIITNWLYFKNNRSIFLAILFHVSVVLASEMFMATNQTKCLVTLVCIVVAAGIVRRDTQFFFTTRPELA